MDKPFLLEQINQAAVAAEVTLLYIAHVFKYSWTSDGQGGHFDTWTEVGEMPCRLVEWRAAQPGVVGEELQSRTDYLMVFFPMNNPYGDALEIRDRLEVHDAADKELVTVEIQAVEVLGTWGILNRVYGVKV